MIKKLKKRYVSEDSVKKALKIDSFRNMSKDKIMQFVSMLPYIDKEVAIAIINQFPELVDFGKTVIVTYSEMCDKILENNRNSQADVIHGYQTILDTLSWRMDNPEIGKEERTEITNQMIDVADKIAAADLQNKKFLEKIVRYVACISLAIAAIVGTGIGINSKVRNGAGNDISQIQ